MSVPLVLNSMSCVRARPFTETRAELGDQVPLRGGSWQLARRQTSDRRLLQQLQSAPEAGVGDEGELRANA